MDDFISQNQYSIPVLLKKPTTNYPSYTLAETKYTVYYALAITSLIYSEILNILYTIAIYIKEYICIETRLKAYFILFLFRKDPSNISWSTSSPFYLTRIEMI
jgi:hypothetical protein